MKIKLTDEATNVIKTVMSDVRKVNPRASENFSRLISSLVMDFKAHSNAPTMKRVAETLTPSHADRKWWLKLYQENRDIFDQEWMAQIEKAALKKQNAKRKDTETQPKKAEN